MIAIKNSILILIVVGIFVALIISNTCNGPIDIVFSGWRDTTGCSANGHVMLNDREAGVITMGFILIVSLVFIGFILGLVKLFHLFKNR